MSAIGETVFPSSRPYVEQGFTLIELLVVVSVAALVAGILFPALERSLDSWRFRSALTTTETMLREARARALRLATPVRFTVRAEDHAIALGSEPPVPLASSVDITGSPAIDFHGDGSSTGGGIKLSDGSGRQVMLVISPDTGLTGLLR